MAFRDFFNVAVKSDLAALSALTDGQGVALFGENTVGDQPIRIYFFWANSSLTPDGENVIAPTGGSGNERFAKYGTIPVSLPSYPTFNNAPSVTIQTVAAAGNGSRLSTTQAARINYSVTINTTVSLSGNSTGYVVLEICPTNSSVAGDWIEVGRVASGQSGTLVVGLVLNQVGGGQLGCDLPAGWYRRLRSVNTAGTPTYTYNSGQEVLI